MAQFMALIYSKPRLLSLHRYSSLANEKRGGIRPAKLSFVDLEKAPQVMLGTETAHNEVPQCAREDIWDVGESDGWRGEVRHRLV